MRSIHVGNRVETVWDLQWKNLEKQINDEIQSRQGEDFSEFWKKYDDILGNDGGMDQERVNRLRSLVQSLLVASRKELMEGSQKKCPFCAETILAEALKCKHCGEIIDSSLREKSEQDRSESKPSLGVAAVLSFFVPGLGQLYKGQLFNGIVWFFFVAGGYVLFVVPGLILHIFCIVGALSGKPSKRSLGVVPVVVALFVFLAIVLARTKSFTENKTAISSVNKNTSEKKGK